MKRATSNEGNRPAKRVRQRPGRRPAEPVDADVESFDHSPDRDAGGSQDLSFGKIRFFHKDKGFGFISCPTESQDVFFGKRQCPPELLDRHPDDLKDVEVSFQLSFTDEGKPRAERVQLGGGGGGAERGRSPGRSLSPRRDPPGGEGLSSGTIVRYDEVKGYGFIAPDDSSEDVFFLRAELPVELSRFDRRDQLLDAKVEFEVHKKSDGKLRAKRMVLLAPPSRAGGAVVGAPQPVPDLGDGARRVVGRISRFDQKKGFGFIKSPDEPEDIFFLPSTIPQELNEMLHGGPIPDVDVEVDVQDSKEGKPRAQRICLLGHSFRAPPSSANVGVIVNFDSHKGYGFIAPDDGGEQLFCLRSELPAELRECSDRKEIIDKRVEFEVKQMPDGKLRALRCLLERPKGPPRDGSSRPCNGRIRQFDKRKGYGFIELLGEPDVFFLPSALPVDLKEGNADMKGMEVFFDLYCNEDGKPRAKNVVPAARMSPQFMPVNPMMAMNPMAMMAAAMGNAMGMPMPTMGPGGPVPMGMPIGMPSGGSIVGGGRDRPSASAGNGRGVKRGEVMIGTIARFNPQKGFGFLVPDQLDEDLFFLRTELPANLVNVQHQDEVANIRVEFEVLTMPDGKLRAQRLSLHHGGPPPPQGAQGEKRRRRDRERDHRQPDEGEELEELESGLVGEMVDFLEAEGGGCDYGRFASKFCKVKKRQLEPHFDIFPTERGAGNQRIELRGHSPQAAKDDPQSDAEQENSDEPAIPPSFGCQPMGYIKSYDKSKGFGFVRSDGLDEDIFFSRQALPEAFQSAKNKQMPDLNGVEVSVELGHSERGARAERVTLLLTHHAEDRCWLLKRR